MNDRFTDPPQPQPTSASPLLWMAVGAVGLAIVLAAGGAAWYAWSGQPAAVTLGAAATVVDAAPLALPTPAVTTRSGETRPAQAGTWVWLVEPADLGRIVDNTFTGTRPGDGTLTACVESVCASMAVHVDLADAITATPSELISRTRVATSLTAQPTFRGSPVVVPLRWSSGDEAVARVDATGKVTFVGSGRTAIHVTGGGVDVAIPVDVMASFPRSCTLKSYASALGKHGAAQQSKPCKEDDDSCEETASWTLGSGDILKEISGYECGSTQLTLKRTSLAEAWAVAERCLELSPALTAIDVPGRMAKVQGEEILSVQTQNGDITGPAEVRVTPTAVTIELPTEACSEYRTLRQDGADVTLIVGGGC